MQKVSPLNPCCPKFATEIQHSEGGEGILFSRPGTLSAGISEGGSQRGAGSVKAENNGILGKLTAEKKNSLYP